MTLPRFCRVLLCAVTATCLNACGSNETKSTADTMNPDSTAAAPATTTPNAAANKSTLVTTPQNMMLVRHRVANFAKWKTSYEAHDSMRLANGVHSYVLGRGVPDTNMVLVATKVDDMAKAKAFAKNASLRDAMRKGGVLGTPAMMFTTMTFQDTAAISSDLRSMSVFTVKDWDKWHQVFDSGKQIRLDNGMQERAYGYDPDNNHKVTLVVAIRDTAKARAYWNSDLIKQRRAQAGVTDKPQMFTYRVVQRY